MRNRTGKPVRHRDFFERPRELAELWHRVSRDHVLMLAPRRVGKTSLLLRMADAPEPGWRATYITVESVDSEARFVARLLIHLVKLVGIDALGGGLGPDLRGALSAGDDPMAAPLEMRLTTTLKDSWASVGAAAFSGLINAGLKTLLLIDEFPIFVRRLMAFPDGDARARLLLDWFREVRTAPAVEDAGIHMILAGSVGLDSVTARGGLTGTISDLEVFRLGPLNDAEAQTFVEALALGEGLEMTHRVRDRLLAAIEWRIPYHLQLMVFEILRAVRFRGERLSPSTVDEARQRLLDPTSRKHFAHWDERLTDPLASIEERALTRAILAAAARDPRGIGPDTLHQLRLEHAPDLDTDPVLRALQSEGYLMRRDGRWHFASSLLRTWWLRWKAGDGHGGGPR